MRRHEVRTPEQALSYVLECTLATVSSMAFRKSRSKYEYERHTLMAQTQLEWIRGMNIAAGPTALEIVENHAGSVAKWAEQYDAKRAPL